MACALVQMEPLSSVISNKQPIYDIYFLTVIKEGSVQILKQPIGQFNEAKRTSFSCALTKSVVFEAAVNTFSRQVLFYGVTC